LKEHAELLSLDLHHESVRTLLAGYLTAQMRARGLHLNAMWLLKALDLLVDQLSSNLEVAETLMAFRRNER